MEDFATTMTRIAQARIRRFERAAKRHYDEMEREARRVNAGISRTSYSKPKSWSFRKDFDPFIVRARAGIYAHGIGQSLKNKTYTVGAPYVFNVMKPQGGSRMITSFGIPDEALSRRTYRSLMSKNMGALSGRSYAYRADINVFDAITYISSEWRDHPRLFVAEYDLQDYFGSVDHRYLFRQMEMLNLRMTPRERLIMEAFLRVPNTDRSSGFPQGTSISLFLSGIALSPLDRSLERLNVGFARFSDDILLWGADYAAVRAGVDMLFEWSNESGVGISKSKSRGLQILSPAGVIGGSEIRDVDSVEFLSHKISLRSVGLAKRPERDIRQRISRLIYANLLRQPLAKTQNLARLSNGVDRDYLTLLSQLRRLLYGGLSEHQVLRFSCSGYVPLTHLTGFVARHPVVTEEGNWRDLDRWLRRQIWLALRRRTSLLREAGFAGSCIPWGVSVHMLSIQSYRSKRTSSLLSMRVPSTTRMARVVRKATELHGTRVTERPRGIY
ncbi:reverse transcriptase domain-containing protein [Micromonospora sp. WMMD975]|uniref:reverse transcriptase domain-containing protein n=1 Tax=Micromonospora sp. WMMD975 TaxID=3016087 RepID=UPI00249BD502|nr:reverse transcriptase domain-containing protein [Micromonospora sp. WMMD975]WFE33793.1 reverse transcriptase domain-containing protein [Micromonospora sp. WMMD975]